MSIFRQHIGSLKRKKELDKNAKVVKRRKGDVDATYADNKKALKSLSWSPKYSLEQALESAWNWEKNYRKIK